MSPTRRDFFLTFFLNATGHVHEAGERWGTPLDNRTNSRVTDDSIRCQFWCHLEMVETCVTMRVLGEA